jgi:hypothetical protein
VVFPDGEFIVKDLAKELQIPYYTIANALVKNRANFKKVREIGGKKGKPQIVWCKK